MDAQPTPKNPKQVSTMMFWGLAAVSVVWLLALTVVVIINMSSDSLSNQDIEDVAVGFADANVVTAKQIVNILSRDDLPTELQESLAGLFTGQTQN
jgi:hypothetical protein